MDNDPEGSELEQLDDCLTKKNKENVTSLNKNYKRSQFCEDATYNKKPKN